MSSQFQYSVGDDLKRRLMTFTCINNKVMLDIDEDQERASKRHKWRTVRSWSRLFRGTVGRELEKRPVPEIAADVAVTHYRYLIDYDGEIE